RRRTVIKDVTEMATAGAARHLSADHAVTAILLRFNRVGHRWLGEARPSTAGVELRIGVEQHRAASGAAVGAVVLRVDVLPTERPLRRGVAQHLVRIRRELLPPLLIRLVHVSLL